MANEGQSQQPDPNINPAAGDDDGFEAAFDQRSNADEGTGEDNGKDAGQEPATEPDPNAGTPSQDGKPAQEPVDNFDPYNGLTPAQAEHFRKLEQSERSQRGRVGALTNKLNRYTAAGSQPQQQVQAPQNQSEAAAPSMEELMAEVSKAAEEYPDAVGPLKAVVEQIGQQVRSLSEQVSPMTEREQQETLNAAYDTLAQDHPDFATISQNPQFLQWFNEQPDGIKAMAGSMDPKEVSLALTVFKAEAGIAMPVSQEPARNDAEARRGRQLDGARDISSRGAPVSSGTPNDFDAAFDSRAKRYK